MPRLSTVLQILFIGLCVGCDGRSAPTNLPPVPAISSSAPKDKPVRAQSKSESEEYLAAIAPYSEKGRQTFSAVKKRFVEGLPPGYAFFALTNLRDSSGTFEQVFIAVSHIKEGRITGRIANNVIVVKGFEHGDPYVFPEGELVDWLITHPDGTEEGNVVGKFLDEWQKQPHK